MWYLSKLWKKILCLEKLSNNVWGALPAPSSTSDFTSLYFKYLQHLSNWKFLKNSHKCHIIWGNLNQNFSLVQVSYMQLWFVHFLYPCFVWLLCASFCFLLSAVCVFFYAFCRPICTLAILCFALSIIFLGSSFSVL